MYGSDPLAYHFNAKLDASLRKTPRYWNKILDLLHCGGFEAARKSAVANPPKPTYGQAEALLATDLATAQLVRLGLSVAVQEAVLADEPALSYWQEICAPPFTSHELHKHAAKHGTECVEQTAREYGIKLAGVAKPEPKAKPKPQRQRRSTVQLRKQVLDLHSRGVLPTAIADTLNVADRRVQDILRRAAA